MDIQHVENQERRGMNNDAIIVGAGVAGAAVAYTLGKDGRQVLVIERNLNEDCRFAGEIMQPGGYQTLIESGLDDCLENIDAQKLLGYAFCKGGKRIILDYNVCQLDVTGYSFHHGRFVQKLRKKAASLTNVKLEQGIVTSLVIETGIVKGIKYKTSSRDEITAYAPLTIVCDGCFSTLRSSLCKPEVTKLGHCLGLLLENCHASIQGYARVFLDRSRMIIYPISSSEYRVLIPLPWTRVPSISNGDMTNFLKIVVAPEIPPDMFSAFITSVERGQVRIMPMRSMPATPNYTPGALLLGDSLSVRHPATAGGMTIALYDVLTIRDQLRHVKNFEDTSSLRHAVGTFYKIRKPKVFKINMCAQLSSLSGVANQDVEEELLQSIYDNLSLSKTLQYGFIAMFSGLGSISWGYLLTSCGLVIFRVVRLLLPIPTPKRILKAARILSASVTTLLIPTICRYWREAW